jgi:hypothetical protein
VTVTPPAVGGSFGPMARTQVDEIDATLLALKGISDRPVWSEQFRESAVVCQSDAVDRPATVNNAIGEISKPCRPQSKLESLLCQGQPARMHLAKDGDGIGKPRLRR